MMLVRWPEPVKDLASRFVNDLSFDVRPVGGGFLTFEGILS